MALSQQLKLFGCMKIQALHAPYHFNSGLGSGSYWERGFANYSRELRNSYSCVISCVAELKPKFVPSIKVAPKHRTLPSNTHYSYPGGTFVVDCRGSTGCRVCDTHSGKVRGLLPFGISLPL